MIRLLVEKYCHNCPYFDPEVKGPETIFEDNKYVTVDTTVVCKDRKRCECISMAVKDELKKENSK